MKETLEVPVIFLKGSGDEVSVVTGLNMGADDYITKPIRPRELFARIKTALRKSGRAQSAFAVGGLHVDTSSGVVKKNGCGVFLSALEYRLLLVFMGNPKGIITRGRLLDELWDAAGEFVNDNTLTVYIKRLREKIEDDPTSPQIILTVRGTGYRLGDGYAAQYRAKRRTNEGEKNMFSGLLRCADCGHNLWYHFNQKNPEIKYFNCSNYKGNRGTCTSTHYIRVDFLEQ